VRTLPITRYGDEIERNLARHLLTQIGKKKHCAFQHSDQVQRLARKILANFASHLLNAALQARTRDQDADALASLAFGLRFG